MTASPRRRLASACQSGTGVPPASRTARLASVSSSDPGKVTIPTLQVTGMLAGYLVPDPRSAGILQLPPADAGQRRVIPELNSFPQLNDGTQARSAAQRYIIDAGLHDRQAAAGLRQLANVGGADPALQHRGRPDALPAQMHPADVPQRARLKAGAVIENLKDAPAPAHFDHHFVAAARPGMLDHIGAGFGDGE